MYIATYFRAYFIPDLPGADETEKLNAIFEKAPLWLLWFTHCDVYGRILGLKLPLYKRAPIRTKGIQMVWCVAGRAF